MDMFARLLPRYLALVLLAVGFLIALHYSGFRQKNGYTGRRAFNEEKFQLLLDRHAEAAETLRRERERRQHHMALLPPELIQYAAPDGKTFGTSYFNVRTDFPDLKRLGIGHVNTTFVELDKDLPKPTVVLAASKLFFRRALNTVASVQRFLPDYKIAFYDLGLTPKQKVQVKALCSVTYKKFYYGPFPRHFVLLGKFSWKPIVMQMALNEYGAILWLEARTVLTTGYIQSAIDAARHTGILLMGGRARFTTFSVTHPGMFSFLPSVDEKLKKTFQARTAPMLLYNTKEIQEKFMRWLVVCAYDRHCMNPRGAVRSCRLANQQSGNGTVRNCHRFDQSAINILLKNMFHFSTKKYVYKKRVMVYQKISTPLAKNIRYCRRVS